MDRTATYTIIIIRTTLGYTAASPAFPDITATANGSRVAYARLKRLIKARLSQAIRSGHPLPRDPVVQARTLRIDLVYLRSQEELA